MGPRENNYREESLPGGTPQSTPSSYLYSVDRARENTNPPWTLRIWIIRTLFFAFLLWVRSCGSFSNWSPLQRTILRCTGAVHCSGNPIRSNPRSTNTIYNTSDTARSLSCVRVDHSPSPDHSQCAVNFPSKSGVNCPFFCLLLLSPSSDFSSRPII